MSDYQTIKNPETNKLVSIYSKLGRKILANYLEIYQYGGSEKEAVVAGNGVVVAGNGEDGGKDDEGDGEKQNVMYKCTSGGCRECNGSLYTVYGMAAHRLYHKGRTPSWVKDTDSNDFHSKEEREWRELHTDWLEIPVKDILESGTRYSPPS